MTGSQLRPAAVVVSGAGSGLGRALAVRLAERGDRLALCGRTPATLEETAALTADAGAADVVWHPFDVADALEAARFAEVVGERFGHINGLVNNAGTLGAIGTISSVDLEEWSAGLRTNVVGTATMTASFARLLGSSVMPGSIINLSGAGIGGPGGPDRVSSYVASKAAIVALTEAFARELAPVRVNAVAPGAVGTSFNAGVLSAGPEIAGSELVDAVRAQESAPVPMQPFLDLALWLLSPASAWMTGRLLSARWECPERLEMSRFSIEESDRYRLRRIDAVMFDEVMAESS